jgi:hypothetical protein
MDHDLRRQLQCIERQLIEALASTDHTRVAQVRQQWSTLLADTVRAANRGTLSQPTAQIAANVAQSMRTLSLAYRQLEVDFKLIEEGAEHRFEAIASSGSSSFHCKPSLQSYRAPAGLSAPPSSIDDDIVNYEPWRRWFLDHLDHPYPENSEKRYLLAALGPSHLTPGQLTTWFTNARVSLAILPYNAH